MSLNRENGFLEFKILMVLLLLCDSLEQTSSGLVAIEIKQTQSLLGFGCKEQVMPLARWLEIICGTWVNCSKIEGHS